MKHLILSLLTVFLGLPVSANTVSKAFTIKGNINTIAASGNVDVEYTPSSTVSVKAYVTEGYLDKVTVSLKGGTLNIGFNTGNNGSLIKKPKAKVVVACPPVASYKATGNSDIEIIGNLSVSAPLKADASGNSDIEFKRDVSGNVVKAATSGNSDISFKRRVSCKNLSAVTSGNSDIEFSDVVADAVSANASGNSDIEIKRGNAVSVSMKSSGNSSIECDHFVVERGQANAGGNSKIECNVRNLKSSKSGFGQIKNKNKK